MGKRPNLTTLDSLFEQGKAFSLSDAQYEQKTGVRLPKNTNYILKRSALAKKCEKHGFKMYVQEKVVFFEKE